MALQGARRRKRKAKGREQENANGSVPPRSDTTRTQEKDSATQTPPPGIKELIWVDPTSLDEHPDNWRIHPHRQSSATKAAILDVGWADALKYNLTTKRLLDGHDRRNIAIKEGWETVPVLVGNWTEEQELKILRDLDTLGGLAEINTDALKMLNDRVAESNKSLKKLKTDDRTALRRLEKDISSHVERIEEGNASPSLIPRSSKRVRLTDDEQREKEEEDEDDPSVLNVEINEEVFFKSSNEWGIPDLRTDRLATEPPRSTWDRSDASHAENAFYCFSARPFPPERSGGVLGFYTDDWRFSRCYEHSAVFVEEILEQDWSALITPDFSLLYDYPVALNLYQLYKSRWCARFWQEFDIPIIPSLLWSTKDTVQDDIALHYSTLPPKIPVVSIQCRTIKKSKDYKRRFRDWTYSLNVANEVIQPGCIVVYGGLELRKHIERDLPTGVEIVLLDSYTTLRRKGMKR